MPGSLPRSTPADQGVDPAAILGFLDAVDQHPGVEMHSLMVVPACSLAGRTAQAVWRHPPLFPSKLRHLHSPG